MLLVKTKVKKRNLYARRTTKSSFNVTTTKDMRLNKLRLETHVDGGTA